MVVLAAVFATPAAAIPQLLVDMRNGEVIYAEEAGRPWHPASLTKLMTAFLAFEAIAEGRVTLDTPVRMSANALKAPPSKVGAPVDTAFRMEDALYLLVVKSANDIAIAIAETVAGSEAQFVAGMNAKAKALGMTATHYVNPHGLHDPRQVTSARDLAILALNIRYLYPQYAEMFATGAVKLGEAKLKSQNDLLGHFAGTTGMKTGYICSSGLNIVATVERQNRQLLAVVLGASSGRERGEMAAHMLLQALAGSRHGTGQAVTALVNEDIAPFDMRPYICGKESREYVHEREVAFPLGLEGQPSYLNDEIAVPVYAASSLGRLRQVPAPRPRPLWAPGPETAVASQAAQSIPLPRPRPATRTALRSGL